MAKKINFFCDKKDQSKTLKFKKIIFRWLTKRYQLVMRNDEDFSEKSALRFNYAKLIGCTFMIFVALLSISLFLINTVLSTWLNPIHIEEENKKKIIHLSLLADSLEAQMVRQANFIKVIQNTMEENNPIVYKTQTMNISKKHESLDLKNLPTVDPLLYNELEENVFNYYKPNNNLTKSFFFTPVKGIITASFDPKIEHYGVDVVAKEKEPIKCIAEGVVMFSSWTLEAGWVIAVQHNNNITSIYKHNASLLKKVGNFVKEGEVIAVMGNSGELSTGPHLHFELWYEGNPINPEDFIIF